MTIKDIFSGLLKTKSSDGWNLFFSSSALTKKKNEAYYFGIIFSATDAIAKSIQNLDYGLFEKDKSGDWQPVEDHPALKILQTPNIIHSDKDFLYLMSSHIDLFGQSFLWPIRTSFSSKQIVELRMVPPSQVETIPSEEDLIGGYKWNAMGKVKKFEALELVNILRPDPINMIQGLSTIAKARYEADNELNSQKLNASFYENGGLPSGVITTEAPVDDTTFQKIKGRIKTQYEGVKNAFKIMFLTHGAVYKSIQPTQRDMEYVSQRKLNRDQILAIFQVPGSMIGISENSNRSTSETEYKVFMQNVVEPRARFIFEKLNRFYLPLFEGTENMEFRFVSPVPGDEKFELEEKVASVGRWRTPNEIRAQEGLEDIEGGDKLDQPLGFSFTDTSSDEEDSPKDTSKEEKKGQNDLLEKFVSATNQKKECSNCNNPDHKHKIEELPKPSEQKGEKLKEYTRRRNAYIQSKEKRYALELAQHYNFFVKEIEKTTIKQLKAIEDDVELTPEVVSSKILPKDEKIEQWKTILFLMILKNNTQIWKTGGKQLKEVFDMNPVEVEGTIENFLSDRANFTSKTISGTLFKRIRSTIDQSVANGDIDLKAIKANVLDVLKDAKDWKVEQIARTELSWAYSEQQMKTYSANGVEEVKWVCGDGACEICQANCGEVVGLNKTFPSGHTNEPAHINCRCMVVAV